MDKSFLFIQDHIINEYDRLNQYFYQRKINIKEKKIYINRFIDEVISYLDKDKNFDQEFYLDLVEIALEIAFDYDNYRLIYFLRNKQVDLKVLLLTLIEGFEGNESMTHDQYEYYNFLLNFEKKLNQGIDIFSSF